MYCNRIFSVSSPYPTEIMLGVWGEENVRTVTFDISPWVAAHGPGVLQIIANRPGETLDTGEPLVYAVSDVSVDGGTATWTVTDVDTAIPGVGSCALVYMVGEDVVAKTPPYKTRIKDTLGHSGTTVPPALEAWYNDILQASADAQGAAERAQEAQAAIEDMTVSAHALEPGEPPTVEKTVEQGVVNLDFGLPSGGGSLPPGGTKGQFLGKNSDTPGDASWKDLPTYAGVYEVTPLARATTTMQTAQTYLDRDIVVREIPYQEVGNLSGGNTATIGG